MVTKTGENISENMEKRGAARKLDVFDSSAGVYLPPGKRRQLQQQKEKEKEKEIEKDKNECKAKERKKEREGKKDESFDDVTELDQSASNRHQDAVDEKDGARWSNSTATNLRVGDSSSTRKDDDDNDKTSINNRKSTILIQRKCWEQEKRIVHGCINRLNVGTIKSLLHDLFAKVNLIRLRGLIVKSLLTATISSPNYGNVYAAFISVINSKLPEIGELSIHRTILSFRRYYKQRNKSSCLAVCIFLGHLFHQNMVHEIVLLQVLSVLLDGFPTDDSIEIAIQLLTVTGQALLEVTPNGVRAVIERLRSILHESSHDINQRIQYKMEQLFQLRKHNFEQHNDKNDDSNTSGLEKELDLVESDDQITFEISLDDPDIQKHQKLDVFQYDEKFEQNENEWKEIQSEILGLNDNSDSDDDNTDSSNDDDEDDDDDEDTDDEDANIDDNHYQGRDITDKKEMNEKSKQQLMVHDLTENELIHLRRSIYLTIMSSATYEECIHKLCKIEIPGGSEEELINMIIECCSQERTFLRYYGLISSRFCLLDNRWKLAFVTSFENQYLIIHRYETNKLRNIAKLFAHLFHTDAMSWSCMSIIHINEDETTSSSRIFIKILVQEIAEAIGISKLKQKLCQDINSGRRDEEKNVDKKFEAEREEELWYEGMFPKKDNLRNTRYAINFFTSIGLGPLTDGLRNYLKLAPKLIMEQATKKALAAKDKRSKYDNDSDDSSSVLSSSSSSMSSSSNTSSSRSYSSSSSSFSSSYTSAAGSYSSSASYSSDDGSNSSLSSSKKKRRSRKGKGRNLKSRKDAERGNKNRSENINKKGERKKRKGDKSTVKQDDINDGDHNQIERKNERDSKR